MALREIYELLGKAAPGSVAIIASARQTNEELYLLGKLKAKLGAVSDSVPRLAEGDKLLLNSDRNPNGNGAKLTEISPAQTGSNLPKIRRPRLASPHSLSPATKAGMSTLKITVPAERGFEQCRSR